MVVAGPDGTGKSAVADRLERGVLPGPVLRLHHRPHVLGRRTARLQVVTEPHRLPPYPKWLSIGKLVFLFADHLLGWMITIRPWLSRKGDVVLERGWWDLAIDPRRYRLQPLPRLTRTLGRLLPRPDITIVLGGDAGTIAARKAELTIAETARQLACWRSLPDAILRAVRADAAAPIDDILTRASDAIATSDAIDRWVVLPTTAAPRWYFPASPARAGVNALQLYHPVTALGRISWETARIVAAVGGFRLLARDGWRPPEVVPELLAPYTPPGARIGVAQGRHRERNTALILDGRTGSPLAFAKIALDDSGAAALAAEVAARECLTRLLPIGLRAPKILHSEANVVVFESVTAHRRLRPWWLPPDVAFLLGRFHHAGARDDGFGPAHGDCAPWNLVRADHGWVLVDWADATENAPPFEDVLHFMVQAHALLGRPGRNELLASFAGLGRSGVIVRRYAEGAQLDIGSVVQLALSYLERSRSTLDMSAPDGRVGLRAREALLRSLRSGARIRSPYG